MSRYALEAVQVTLDQLSAIELIVPDSVAYTNPLPEILVDADTDENMYKALVEVVPQLPQAHCYHFYN